MAFDEALDSCFRNAIYPAYKANRDPAPPELRRQFAWCKALCQALGLAMLAHADYEADDLIGSAVHRARGQGFRSVIVSADKDLSQLLHEHDEQYDFAKRPALGRGRREGAPRRARAPDRRLPGADRRCGRQHPRRHRHRRRSRRRCCWRISQSLDALLERIDEVPFLRLRGAATLATRLREQREHALLWRQLTTIALDAPLPEHGFARGRGDADELAALADWVKFGPMTRKRLGDAAGL